VLQELASEKALERFRIEYEKLYKTLRKSHGNLTDIQSVGVHIGTYEQASTTFTPELASAVLLRHHAAA
jgi:hypothetical protein